MSSAKKLKILLINAYNMKAVHSLFKVGLAPSHHLFGAAELEKHHNVEIIIPPQEKYSIFNKIGGWFDIALLDQQIRAIIALRKCDILYAPYAVTNTKLIVLGKMFGWIKKPVIILVHHPFFGKPSSKLWKRRLVRRLIMQYDTIIFLSRKMRSEIIDVYDIDHDYAEKHFFLSHWGIDSEYFKKYLTRSSPENLPIVISSGKSGRDFDLLIRASSKINFPFKIYCRKECYPKLSTIPPHVTILSGFFSYEQICKDYAQSRVVMIPLAPDPEGTMGFTSLLEALAMGKPVIMTKNKNIDIDIEGEKIGMVIDENDVDGWVNAIALLLDNFPLLKEMGENSLRLAQEKFNINVFAKDLAAALQDTYIRHLEKTKK